MMIINKIYYLYGLDNNWGKRMNKQKPLKLIANFGRLLILAAYQNQNIMLVKFVKYLIRFTKVRNTQKTFKMLTFKHFNVN